MIELFGGEVERCPPVSFSNEQHYYQKAKAWGQQPGNYWTDQFENMANSDAHYRSTAPEIWEQTAGKVDAFISASGTGGTISGVSRYLKSKRRGIKIFVVDPPGSGLYNFVTRVRTCEGGENMCFHPFFFAQGDMAATQGHSEVEGIGILRLTSNFKAAQVDGAVVCTDQEAVDMTYFLLKHEGLYVGPSAGLNVAGAVKLARQLGPGHTIVTVLCDTGDRYITKFFDKSW
jgi:cysteine synthase A